MVPPRRLSMELKHLQNFVTIADKHSFTTAAEQCFISQSALSQQMKNLEQALEIKIFARKGRSFTLTPAGTLLYHRIKPLLLQIDDLFAHVQRVHHNQNFNLRLGLLSSMDKTEALNEALKRIIFYSAGCEVSFAYGTPDELYENFSNGIINAFISDSTRLGESETLGKFALFSPKLQCELPRALDVPYKDKNKRKLDVATINERQLEIYIITEVSQFNEERRQLTQLLGFTCPMHAVSSLSEGRRAVAQSTGAALIFDRSLMRGDNTTHTKLNRFTLTKNGQPLRRPLSLFVRKNIEPKIAIEELCAALRDIGTKQLKLDSKLLSALTATVTESDNTTSADFKSTPTPPTTDSVSSSYTHQKLIY